MANYSIGLITISPFGEFLLLTADNVQLDISHAECANFKNLDGLLDNKLCAYDPSKTAARVGNYPTLTGKLYLLPLDKSRLAVDDTIAPGTRATKLRLFILARAIGTGHISDDYFIGRKFEYYVNLDDPLLPLNELIAKTLHGEGVVRASICNALFDDIPVNFQDIYKPDGKLINSRIKGSEMASYKLPWYTVNSNVIANAGRPLEWEKTPRENNILEGEVIHGNLYKVDNKLQAYPKTPDLTTKIVSAFVNLFY